MGSSPIVLLFDGLARRVDNNPTDRARAAFSRLWCGATRRGRSTFPARMPMNRLFTISALLLAVGLAGCTGGSVERGQALFLAGTFNGNGRTCATCHRPDENFSISLATIRNLPRDDKLFVPVENLEDPVKLRADGLIRVVDGDDGINEFRQTPKLTHLRKLCDVKGDCGPLGLRGDRERNLCQFANEAIANHLTRRVGGVAGADFRLLTTRECDDMIAYLVSRRVGR